MGPRTATVLLSIASAGAAITSAYAVLHAQDVSLAIVAPSEDAYLSGPTLLRARMTPANAASAVTFFVDGRQVCALTREPFECEWDAGPSVSEHQIRAVATLAAGGRVVQTIRTKGIGYNERVNVDVVQVTVTVSDGRGKFIPGLPQSAFRLLEDHRAQQSPHLAS